MTFEAENQFYYALICFSLGVFSRAVGYLPQLPFLFFKSKAINAVGYFLACFCALIIFIIAKNYYRLPSLRAYMAVLFLAGFLLLSKICDKKIAFLLSKLYNKLYNKFKLKPKKLKLREADKNDDRKVKKGSGVRHGGGGFAVGYSDIDNGVSNNRNKIERKRNKRARGGNRAPAAAKRATRG